MVRKTLTKPSTIPWWLAGCDAGKLTLELAELEAGENDMLLICSLVELVTFE